MSFIVELKPDLRRWWFMVVVLSLLRFASRAPTCGVFFKVGWPLGQQKINVGLKPDPRRWWFMVVILSRLKPLSQTQGNYYFCSGVYRSLAVRTIASRLAPT